MNVARSSDTWAEPVPELAGNAQRPTSPAPAPAPLSSPPRSQGEEGVRLPPIFSPPTNYRHLLDINYEALSGSRGEPVQQGQSHSSDPAHERLRHTGPTSQASRSRGSVDPSTLERIRPADQNPDQEERRNDLSHSRVLDSDSEDHMSSSRRRQSRSGNLVDLTSSPNLTMAPGAQQPRTRKRSSTSNGRDEGSASKRTKRTATSRVTLGNEDEEEDEAPSADAELLKAQQQEALKMQEENKDEGAQKIGQRTCIICLENYTNATISNCGKSARLRLPCDIGVLTRVLQVTSSATNV